MRYHGVHFLHLPAELDGLTMLAVASRVGLFLFVGVLYGILFGIFLKYFAFFSRVPGAMHQARFCTGRPISQMDSMIFHVLASADLLGVGFQGRLSSLIFTPMTCPSGFCPGGLLRICTSCVFLLYNLHAFKHGVFILVGIPLKVSFSANNGSEDVANQDYFGFSHMIHLLLKIFHYLFLLRIITNPLVQVGIVLPL